MTPEQAAANRRKNRIGCVRAEPTAYDLTYDRVIEALGAADKLSVKQRRQLYVEIGAELEKRVDDLDAQER